MNSRYDMMIESPVVDIDMEAFPDPLNMNYSKFVFTDPPNQVSPTQQMLQKPYLIAYSLYQMACYEDVVLDINNIPHIGLIYNYDIVKFPILDDITSFINGEYQ